MENTIEKITFGQMVKNFFVHPTKLFEQYIEKPSYSIKLIIMCIVSAIYAVVLSITSKSYVEKYMNDITKNMTPQQVESVKKVMNAVNSSGLKVVTAVIGVIIAVFIASAVYYLFIKIFKGEGTYSQVVSVYTTAAMATVIGEIIKIFYMIATKNPIGIQSQLHPSYVSTITNSLDIFSLWKMILMVLGISAVFKISKKKSTVIVVGLWAIMLLISLGFLYLSLMNKGKV